MKREGGSGPKQTVTRIMSKLLAPELQTQINRPGTHNKIKFFSSLEDPIKGKYYKCIIILNLVKYI